MAKKYDFCGWATRNDLLCADGRTIRRDAFKDCDGKKVPLFWNHQHGEVSNILGHGILYNKPEGVRVYGYFNETDAGKHARLSVNNGDVEALSIWANELKQVGGDVIHGTIREVSLVPAGANPGAFIDDVISHGSDTFEGEIFTNESLELYHADDEGDEEEAPATGGQRTIGQVLDTNSQQLARALEEVGIHVVRMVSVGDKREEIAETLLTELSRSQIVFSTGGLGPTKDDITKAVLAQISGSKGYVKHEGQMQKVVEILHGRGLDVLPSNENQAMVPDRAHVIVNALGTAPIMVFRDMPGSGSTLYALPGVPHEAVGAIPSILEDIRAHQSLSQILHRSVMVYGIAESALAAKIASWEDALPTDMHLAYLPNTLTGIRLRLSCYGSAKGDEKERMEAQLNTLKSLLGDLLYSEEDTDLETTIGQILKEKGLTLSCAESCTGGMIAHMITSVPGSSGYFLDRHAHTLPRRERHQLPTDAHLPSATRGEGETQRPTGGDRPRHRRRGREHAFLQHDAGQEQRRHNHRQRQYAPGAQRLRTHPVFRQRNQFQRCVETPGDRQRPLHRECHRRPLAPSERQL